MNSVGLVVRRGLVVVVADHMVERVAWAGDFKSESVAHLLFRFWLELDVGMCMI